MRERAAKVVYGPATFLNHAVAAVNTEIGSLTASAAVERSGRPRRRRAALAKARGARRRADQAQPCRRPARWRSSGNSQPPGAHGHEHRGTGAGQLLAGVPSISDPAFLRQIVFGSATGIDHAGRALLLPVPDERRGGHPGQAARRAQRQPAAAGDRLDPRRRAHRPSSASRGELHGHRRAGAARRSERRDRRAARPAAGGCDRGDGARAAGRVPAQPAPAAAGRRRSPRSRSPSG